MPVPTLRWEEEEAPTGVFLNDTADEAPRLLDLPKGLRARARPSVPDDLGPAAAVLLRAIAEALRHHAAAAPPRRFALDGLAPADRRAVEDLLGQGEVQAFIGGATEGQAVESVLTGLWRVRLAAPGGDVAEHLEIADIPGAVRDAVAAMRDAVPVPAPGGEGVMNAPALLAEIAHRAATWQAGAPNHVISLTLLPVSEADQALLHATLGAGPVVALAQGYGTVRVTATACRQVWSVQYLNAREAVILDTLEIGDVPAAIRAADEDFADSAVRLAEMAGTTTA